MICTQINSEDSLHTNVSECLGIVRNSRVTRGLASDFKLNSHKVSEISSRGNSFLSIGLSEWTEIVSIKERIIRR